MKIVTHKGQAHRDEFVAACLLLAKYEATIDRRDCTREDLDDPEVIVLDQGGELSINNNNFDHHQFPRDHSPSCSITLVLHSMGVDMDLARKALVWLEFSEVLDSKGPHAAAAWLGIDRDGLAKTMSPVEAQILRVFEKRTQITPEDPLSQMMREMGQGWMNYMTSFSDCYESFPSKSCISVVGRHGVVDLRAYRPEEMVLGAIELRLKDSPEITITISNDDRDNGYTLYRRNDAPGVDFSRLEGMPGVGFAHKSGFIAKVSKDAPVFDLIAKAIS